MELHMTATCSNVDAFCKHKLKGKKDAKSVKMNHMKLSFVEVKAVYIVQHKTYV
jgi:hypothetical protein